MNTNEIHCRDCGTLLGEMRDGALSRPAGAALVAGTIPCPKCHRRYTLARGGELTAEPIVDFTARRRAEMIRSQIAGEQARARARTGGNHIGH